MPTFLKSLAVAMAVFALALGGCRGDAGDSTQAELVAQLEAVDAALEAGDTEKLVDLSTPDALIEAMVKSDPTMANMEVGQAREMIRGMASAAMAMVEIDDHEIGTDRIEYFTTPSGAEAARIPMSMTMSAMGQKIVSSGDMIALRKDGEWIVISASDANSIAMMRKAFPELEGVEIEAASMDMVAE